MAATAMLVLAAGVAMAMQGELAAFRATATPAQARQVSDAITTSPALQMQMEQLAQAGQLRGVSIKPVSELRALGPFNAAVDHGHMVMTVDLLAQLVKNRIYDVVTPGEILPNNTTFVLAHLAYHVEHPPSPPHVEGTDATASMQAYIKARLRDEAGAYVQAWNDTIDGVRGAAPGGRITPQQVALVMLNLRYRFIFVKALQQGPSRLSISPSGDIAPTEQNLEALAAALSTSSVADLQ